MNKNKEAPPAPCVTTSAGGAFVVSISSFVFASS